MKKQNNILTYIAKITLSVALMASMYACTDEDIIKKNTVEEGIPVEISMKFTSPKMDNISTRGLDEQQELQVNNLYILIFNEDGSALIEEGSGLYENTTASEEIILKTTSGKRLIYGIANAKTNQQDQIELIKKLENVKKLTDLNELVITTRLLSSGAIEVDRTSPDLLMSGAYMESDHATKSSGYCEIRPGTNTLSGKLQLIHLESHIKFNIHTGPKVTKIEPKKWQVLNVPTQSYIIEKGDTTKCGKNQSDYANSIEYNNQTIHAEKDSRSPEKDMHTFNFYQFENFNYAKESLKDAKHREEEIKEGGLNTGRFVHVDGYPTYVEFSAYLELTTPATTSSGETTQYTHRVADIKLMILLGGINESQKYDFRNFNTWRNQKYTYDVTINDVNDIVTEVTKKDEKETRPGIEGDVIDAQDKVRILDAHYNCFNIILTPDQVDRMSIMVHTPFDEVKYNSETDKGLTEPKTGTNRDYKWIKFKYLGKRSDIDLYNDADYIPLATFRDSKEPLLDIYSLRGDVMSRGNGTTEFYYTVFIEEYYYDNIPNGKEWTPPYWKHFVNKEDRYVMLIYSPEESTDKESSYSKSRYFIKQKSIQTYYSTTDLTGDRGGTALGMEHVNETLEPEWKKEDTQTIDHNNGFKNCKDFIGNKSQDDLLYKHSRFSALGTKYCAKKDASIFKLKENHLNALCLTRNRDENGDGKIDGEELKWYVPTYKQISGMYLGATSLPSPLFTPPSDGSTVIFNDPKYHFMTSDGDKIWAQEGCSNKGLISNNAKEMRCVRNLGLSAVQSYEAEPSQPYEKSIATAHYVFDMSRVAESNLRSQKVNTLGKHENFKDTKNKPYKKFELANKFSETKFKKGERTWGKFLIFEKGVDQCQDYYEGNENDPTRGKGKWRTPNQRELLIIYNLLGIAEMRYTDTDKTVYGMYSCTYWDYFKLPTANDGGYRIFGAHVTADKMFLDNGPEKDYKSEHGTILRCVRDID